LQKKSHHQTLPLKGASGQGLYYLATPISLTFKLLEKLNFIFNVFYLKKIYDQRPATMDNLNLAGKG